MRIRMYNCYFGDCFCIESKKKNVYIDYGIHNHSLSLCFPAKTAKKRRDTRHKEIMDDILAEDVLPDFLLTHYHLDHYSGLVYMMKQLKMNPPFKSPVFDKFYLPDIWNVADRMPLSILLLEDILKNAKLSKDKRSYTLYELVKFFTVGVQNVVFVKVGTELDFPTECVALWPDLNKISKDFPPMLEDISRVDKDFLDDLKNIALQFQELIRNYKEITLEGSSSVVVLIDEFIEKHYASLDFLNNEENKESMQVFLNSYDNDISIVFHNKHNSDTNCLFTGDIPERYMKLIASASIPRMHDKYYYIKIPHHGTDNHYYDFKTYEPEVVMIPNGSCISDSYRISQKYVSDFKNNTRIYCSNCNWCEARPNPSINKCVCKYRNIIYPYNMKYIV